GSAVHTLILEPEKFNNQFVVGPDVHKNTKIWKDFVKSNEGVTVLDEMNYQAILDCSNSVLSHPTAMNILRDGIPERSYFWRDSKTKVKCKCRPDWLRLGDREVFDLKTTTDASKE